jgi:hypothetical protein
MGPRRYTGAQHVASAPRPTIGALVVSMAGPLEVGRGVRPRHEASANRGEDGGAGALDGVVFALLGLLVAFPFSGGEAPAAPTACGSLRRSVRAGAGTRGP